MKSLSIVCVLAAISYAFGGSPPPPIPNTPMQFTATITVTTETPFFHTSDSGIYYYDYLNQRDRTDVSEYGQTVTTLNLYEQGHKYNWTNGAHCMCSPLTEPLSALNVPFGAEYKGLEMVDGAQCDVWLFQNPIMKMSGMSFTYYVSDDKVLRFNTTMSSMFGSQFIYIDFSNYNLTAPDPSFFAPLPSCSCSTPIPPYVPDKSSCPGHPDPACQCASSSSLTFCTGVNYPISNAIDVATMDEFVSLAYKSATSVLPNPSKQCLANFQAFLCAFYFPQCIGSNFPVTFLPCDTICPFCSCFEGVSKNCTAALPHTACTDYGGVSYCT
eukprot:TRINITY_DN5164_c0_g1_i1.p1 TRINITY_DN5164_c0_g1~~TRINITY_DN5164_c0_g1_i1.p1  ORF type:complete len:327 (-),score=54.09 TRINITY_DN5164_c0_g1_i1:9-989(-)